MTMEVVGQSALMQNLNSTGKLKNLMLASHDIDLGLFRSQLRQIGNVPANIYVFVSEDDFALNISRRLSGGVDRVGDAPAEDLFDLGVTVIDLSQIENSASGSHAKFTGSPEVVQLIGRRLKDDNFGSPDNDPAVVEVLNGIPVLRALVD